MLIPVGSLPSVRFVRGWPRDLGILGDREQPPHVSAVRPRAGPGPGPEGGPGVGGAGAGEQVGRGAGPGQERGQTRHRLGRRSSEDYVISE